MNRRQTIWFYALISWFYIGCKVFDQHVGIDEWFDGQCACQNYAMFRAGRGDTNDLPEWSGRE